MDLTRTIIRIVQADDCLSMILYAFIAPSWRPFMYHR